MSNVLFEKVEVPPDKTDYQRLCATDRALIDRALFSHIVARQGNQFVFSPEEIKRRDGNPTSKEVEWDIWRLRDQYAERFNGNNAQDAVVRRDLSRQGQHAPQNATAMLDAINAFNGDECGCTIAQAPTITTPMLNQIIRTGQGR